MNNDLIQTNRYVPYANSSQTTHNRKPETNPFLTNSSIGPERLRHDNQGLNHSIRYNAFINDITQVVIDSRNRNRELYPLPNNYKIETNKLFSNVKIIKLVDININNFVPPINLMNNSLIWEYPTSEEATSINNILLPTDSLTDNKIYSGTLLPEGFYNTTNIESMLENTLGKIKHQDEFSNISEGSSNRFHVDVNEETHLVKIINRAEECPIFAIQTILNDTDDILATFRVGIPPTMTTSDEAFFITFKKELGTGTQFPLVITNATFISNISEDFINCQTYFEESYGTTTNPDQPYLYELFDELDIAGTIYYRYKFTPSNSSILVQSSENIIYKMSGGNLDKTLCNIGGTSLNFMLNESDKPVVGRALPFKLFYQRSQITTELIDTDSNLNPINEDGSIKTVLDILGWNVKNNDIDEQDRTLYQYIHTNKNSYLSPDISFGSTVNGYDFSIQDRLLNIENKDGQFWFRSDEYIFLRIIVEDDKDKQSEFNDQIVLAGPIENIEDQPDQLYYNFNVNALVPPAQRLQTKNTNNIFAKIDLNVLPSNVTNSIDGFITNNIDFKNEQLDELREITVQFIDREGRLLNLRGDHNFVLEIVTKRNILENILVNTKNG